MPLLIKDLTDLNNQLKEAGTKLVVIDFFATWCGPCKLIAPRLEELAKEYEGKVLILKVDVDECEDIAMEYNISSMPTFVFIKDRKQINSFAGANGEKLADFIAKNV
ncbi:PREDICTED: thioredoxin-2-like [Rhagoletis zephyria]|uniref:thioredoxin-2-like n=1 Tax=Rhagoletis zephyria TaxID=28612 RepID=UPI0008116C59|nr:PREDICTED: thioredoxin-2-like [Rhagoletis zephyria]XP_036346545.1 thioredoxin-2-like [Rhagoletis pomonella]XP_036346547.1 thioredoxin-2-like [Rhagoletis pomonella]